MSAGADAARVLEWYSRPTRPVLAAAGSRAANRCGLRDLHGLIWEWTSDFLDSALGEGAALTCGAASANAIDPSDYATFMRIAFRASLQPGYTLKNLGFRCARGTR